jgi:hypothetical protein
MVFVFDQDKHQRQPTVSVTEVGELGQGRTYYVGKSYMFARWL